MGEEDRLYGMTSDSTIEIEAADPTYAVKVGSRLRAIRKQKRLSLQEVEASSGQEFKASHAEESSETQARHSDSL